MQLQPCLVVTKPLARQARPVEGMFAFLDVQLGSATLIVELHHLFRFLFHVGDDEAELRQQFARRPYDLGDDTAFLFPGFRFVLEFHVDPFDFVQ